MDRLAKERTLVSCQLLARQVESVPIQSSKADKRLMADDIIPERMEGQENMDEAGKHIPRPFHNPQEQLAICRVTYRPTFLQVFPTDIAESLIATGNASVSSTILGREIVSSDNASTCIQDSSQRLQDLRNDVKYLDRLAKTEFEAARQSMGMWSVPEVRESKREVVEEVEFQCNASFIQKVWRWIRGG